LRRAIGGLIVLCVVGFIFWWQSLPLSRVELLVAQRGASAGEELLGQSSPEKQAGIAYFGRREYRKAQAAFQKHRRSWPGDAEAAIYGENATLAALSVQPMEIAVLMSQPFPAGFLRGLQQAQSELNYDHLDRYHLRRPMKLVLVDLGQVSAQLVADDSSVVAAIAPQLDAKTTAVFDQAKLLAVTVLEDRLPSTYVYPLLPRWIQASPTLAARYQQRWQTAIEQSSWSGYNGLRQIDGAIDRVVLGGRSYEAQRSQLGPIVAHWLQKS
jgi:hypothetical protein